MSSHRCNFLWHGPGGWTWFSSEDFSCSVSCFLLARHLMLNTKQFKKIAAQGLISDFPEQVVVYSQVSAWFLLAVRSGSLDYVGRMTEGRLSLSDPQSWTREIQCRYRWSGEQNNQLHREYRMHQAPHFKTHSPGWELISSLFHSLTLRALSLSSQQSWKCFSSASAHFNDSFSLVSCTWKAGSLLWSSYLSHAQPVVAGPKCPAWFSQAPVPKSILWWSLTTDLQRSEITGTIWITTDLSWFISL